MSYFLHKKRKKFDLGWFLKFEQDPTLKRVLGILISAYTSNKFTIKVNNEELKKEVFSDLDVLKECNISLTNLTEKALPRILIYGFVSYRIDPKNKLIIECIDYENGTLYYFVNENDKVELYWEWNHGERHFNNLVHSGYSMIQNQKTPINHFIWDEPTWGGKIKGYISGLCESYRKYKELEGWRWDGEKKLYNPHFYLQRQLPGFKPEEYNIFQNHTMMMNSKLEQMDDPNKRFLNMQGIGPPGLETWEPDWKDRLQEKIVKFFQIKRYFSVEFQKFKNIDGPILVSGELIEPKIIKQPKPSDLYLKAKLNYKADLEEMFGVSLSSLTALKEHVRLAGFILKSPARLFKARMEQFLTKAFNVLYENYFKDYTEKLEGVKNLFEIEINPTEYQSEADLKMLIEGGVPLKDLITLTMGEEYQYLVPTEDETE